MNPTTLTIDNQNREDVQRSAKVGAPGLVNFVPALAYRLTFKCLKLPAAFSHPAGSTFKPISVHLRSVRGEMVAQNVILGRGTWRIGVDLSD